MKALVITALLIAGCGLQALLPGQGHAGRCYMSKNCFGVLNPYQIEKVCYYFAHENRLYSTKAPRESEFAQTLKDIELHNDPLHIQFVKMLLEKKFLPLAKGTPVFSCQYDLDTVVNNPDQAVLQMGRLPEFHCGGFPFTMVAVRPVNISVCYWVAVANVVCHDTDEFPHFGGSEVHVEPDSPANSGKVAD
ncbi:MAG: hypothetical protein QM278_00540 [Pseudomonadota bacterium]|nr:hypothetical protein [Pseudomonadota bacterium]